MLATAWGERSAWPWTAPRARPSRSATSAGFAPRSPLERSRSKFVVVQRSIVTFASRHPQIQPQWSRLTIEQMCRLNFALCFFSLQYCACCNSSSKRSPVTSPPSGARSPARAGRRGCPRRCTSAETPSCAAPRSPRGRSPGKTSRQGPATASFRDASQRAFNMPRGRGIHLCREG